MGLPASRRQVEELVDAHYQALYRYAIRLTGSAEEAEDLTQEAFCKAQMKFAQLLEPARVKAWLFSILRNAYLHRLREKRNERALSLDHLGEFGEPGEGSERTESAEPGGDGALPDIEPERLQAALARLPEAFRTPIVLYFFEDFSYRDIAEQMDLPIGTVMSRLSRAKAHLRAELQRSPQPGLTAAPRRPR